jgi:hypothetical protein
MFEPIKVEEKKKTTRTTTAKSIKTIKTIIEKEKEKPIKKANTINVIEHNNFNVNDMPKTFLKYKLDDIDSLNDDLEKELAEIDDNKNNEKNSDVKVKKNTRTKNIIVAE